MARTSVQECIPLLEISSLQNYITEEEKLKYYGRCEELSKMLCGLINRL